MSETDQNAKSLRTTKSFLVLDLRELAVLFASSTVGGLLRKGNNRLQRKLRNTKSKIATFEAE